MPRNSSGQFIPVGSEPKGKVIGVRLPRSLDSHLRIVAGDRLGPWIEQAIREKLTRS
jgi:hypothetical protein